MKKMDASQVEESNDVSFLYFGLGLAVIVLGVGLAMYLIGHASPICVVSFEGEFNNIEAFNFTYFGEDYFLPSFEASGAVNVSLPCSVLSNEFSK